MPQVVARIAAEAPRYHRPIHGRPTRWLLAATVAATSCYANGPWYVEKREPHFGDATMHVRRGFRATLDAAVVGQDVVAGELLVPRCADAQVGRLEAQSVRYGELRWWPLAIPVFGWAYLAWARSTSVSRRTRDDGPTSRWTTEYDCGDAAKPAAGRTLRLQVCYPDGSCLFDDAVIDASGHARFSGYSALAAVGRWCGDLKVAVADVTPGGGGPGGDSPESPFTGVVPPPPLVVAARPGDPRRDLDGAALDTARRCCIARHSEAETLAAEDRCAAASETTSCLLARRDCLLSADDRVRARCDTTYRRCVIEGSAGHGSKKRSVRDEEQCVATRTREALAGVCP